MNFSWLDYAIVAFSLFLSLGTGIYHAFKSFVLSNDKSYKVSEKDEYLMGGRRLPSLPVALSLLTAYLSGILMIAFPAEMFQRGPQIWFNSMTASIASVLTAVFFLPVFYKMHATCIHEYFEYRFHSKLIRKTFSTLFLFQNLCYMSIVIYAPAVALAHVIQMDKSWLILIFGLTTTIYTTIGGLKAVVWTDSLQAILMYGGVFAILYKGLNSPRVGSFLNIWELAYDTGRVSALWRSDLTLAQYNSLWINLTCGTIIWLAYFGVNQLAVQRYLCLPRLSEAKKIIYYTILPYIVLCSIVSFIGFIALAYYFNCNPLESGEITDRDQLTILFAKEVLTPTAGLFGLYVSCIMSATLSTLSSGMNSMATAAYEDFFKSGFAAKYSDSKATKINKAIVLFIGLLSTTLAFAAEPLGGILRVCISVLGALSGPFVGIFILAMFWPRAGQKSAFISLVSSIAVMVVICSINYIEDPYKDYFLATNTSTMGCGGLNFTVEEIPKYDAHFGNPNTSYIARLSTFAYPGIGLFVMLIIGVPLTYYYNEQNPNTIMHLTVYGRYLPWPKGKAIGEGFQSEPGYQLNEAYVFDEKDV